MRIEFLNFYLICSVWIICFLKIFRYYPHYPYLDLSKACWNRWKSVLIFPNVSFQFRLTLMESSAGLLVSTVLIFAWSGIFFFFLWYIFRSLKAGTIFKTYGVGLLFCSKSYLKEKERERINGLLWCCVQIFTWNIFAVDKVKNCWSRIVPYPSFLCSLSCPIKQSNPAF